MLNFLAFHIDISGLTMLARAQGGGYLHRNSAFTHHRPGHLAHTRSLKGTRVQSQEFGPIRTLFTVSRAAGQAYARAPPSAASAAVQTLCLRHVICLRIAFASYITAALASICEWWT